MLDGTSSSDPDSTPGTRDDIILFEWFEGYAKPGQTLLGVGETLDAILFLGEHRLTLRVTDSQGETSFDEVVISIVDTTPPEVAVTFDESILWPPNHRMVPVGASAVAADVCDPAPAIHLVSVASSEPDDAPGNGDGATSFDIQGVDAEMDTEFSLRAERDGAGGGRTYTVTYAASDASGNAATATATVFVPHDQGGVVEPVVIGAAETSAGTLLRWSEVAGAVGYNVARGRVVGLKEANGAVDLGALTCIEPLSPDANTSGSEDAETPAPGEAFFYVVEYDAGYRSEYGTEGALKPRVVSLGGCRLGSRRLTDRLYRSP